jgi:hypothetical protein
MKLNSGGLLRANIFATTTRSASIRICHHSLTNIRKTASEFSLREKGDKSARRRSRGGPPDRPVCCSRRKFSIKIGAKAKSFVASHWLQKYVVSSAFTKQLSHCMARFGRYNLRASVPQMLLHALTPDTNNPTS